MWLDYLLSNRCLLKLECCHPLQIAFDALTFLMIACQVDGSKDLEKRPLFLICKTGKSLEEELHSKRIEEYFTIASILK